MDMEVDDPYDIISNFRDLSSDAAVQNLMELSAEYERLHGVTPSNVEIEEASEYLFDREYSYDPIAEDLVTVYGPEIINQPLSYTSPTPTLKGNSMFKGLEPKKNIRTLTIDGRGKTTREGKGEHTREYNLIQGDHERIGDLDNPHRSTNYYHVAAIVADFRETNALNMRAIHQETAREMSKPIEDLLAGGATIDTTRKNITTTSAIAVCGTLMMLEMNGMPQTVENVFDVNRELFKMIDKAFEENRDILIPAIDEAMPASQILNCESSGDRLRKSIRLRNGEVIRSKRERVFGSKSVNDIVELVGSRKVGTAKLDMMAAAQRTLTNDFPIIEFSPEQDKRYREITKQLATEKDKAIRDNLLDEQSNLREAKKLDLKRMLQDIANGVEVWAEELPDDYLIPVWSIKPAVFVKIACQASPLLKIEETKKSKSRAIWALSAIGKFLSWPSNAIGKVLQPFMQGNTASIASNQLRARMAEMISATKEEARNGFTYKADILLDITKYNENQPCSALNLMLAILLDGISPEFRDQALMYTWLMSFTRAIGVVPISGMQARDGFPKTVTGDISHVGWDYLTPENKEIMGSKEKFAQFKKDIFVQRCLTCLANHIDDEDYGGMGILQNLMTIFTQMLIEYNPAPLEKTVTLYLNNSDDSWVTILAKTKEGREDRIKTLFSSLVLGGHSANPAKTIIFEGSTTAPSTIDYCKIAIYEGEITVKPEAQARNYTDIGGSPQGILNNALGAADGLSGTMAQMFNVNRALTEMKNVFRLQEHYDEGSAIQTVREELKTMGVDLEFKTPFFHPEWQLNFEHLGHKNVLIGDLIDGEITEVEARKIRGSAEYENDSEVVMSVYRAGHGVRHILTGEAGCLNAPLAGSKSFYNSKDVVVDRMRQSRVMSNSHGFLFPLAKTRVAADRYTIESNKEAVQTRLKIRIQCAKIPNALKKTLSGVVAGLPESSASFYKKRKQGILPVPRRTRRRDLQFIPRGRKNTVRATVIDSKQEKAWKVSYRNYERRKANRIVEGTKNFMRALDTDTLLKWTTEEIKKRAQHRLRTVTLIQRAKRGILAERGVTEGWDW